MPVAWPYSLHEKTGATESPIAQLIGMARARIGLYALLQTAYLRVVRSLEVRYFLLYLSAVVLLRIETVSLTVFIIEANCISLGTTKQRCLVGFVWSPSNMRH